MALPDVKRTETKVVKNTLPTTFFGFPFKRVFGYDLGIVPPIIDNHYMLDPKPKLVILDQAGNELFCFQTSTVFKFENIHSREETTKLLYNLIITAVNEFNVELAKLENNLTIGRRFERDSYETLYPDIERALLINNVN